MLLIQKGEFVTLEGLQELAEDVMRHPLNKDSSCIRILLKGTFIDFWFELRPSYCDRGKFVLHVDRVGDPAMLCVDNADMFPRIYFLLKSLKEELNAWIIARR